MLGLAVSSQVTEVVRVHLGFGMIDCVIDDIELNWKLELCDIGTVTGPEPGIRCDANPVTSLRRRPWLVGA